MAEFHIHGCSSENKFASGKHHCFSTCFLDECRHQKQSLKSFFLIHIFFFRLTVSSDPHILLRYLTPLSVLHFGGNVVKRTSRLLCQGKNTTLGCILFIFCNQTFIIFNARLWPCVLRSINHTWESAHARTQTAHPLWDQSAPAVRANTCNFYALPEWFV